MVKIGFNSVYGNIIYDKKKQITVLKIIFEKWNKQYEKALKNNKKSG